jgi:hypothetical protein
MLHVQKYLRSGKTLQDLKIEHGVKSYIHNGKIGLTYDQIEAREQDPLSQQCRGLILREGTYDIVACPMFRFFNLEQKETAAEIDWSTACFEDKLDGTMCIAYWDLEQDRWCVGTRSRPEADGNIDESDITFAKLFDLAVKEMNLGNDIQDLMNYGNQGMLQIDKNCTYCFELTSPFNRIVCDYKKLSITLLAVRDNKTLTEYSPEVLAANLKVPAVEKYDFKNINHMIQVVKDWDPKEKEGVVIKDANFNRVKVKSPLYVIYNHMRDSLSTSYRGCVEVILLEKDDDIIGMMPEMIANRIRRLKPIIAEVFRRTQIDYDSLKHHLIMKDFALEAMTKLWPGALFALKRNKTPDLKTFALGDLNVAGKIPANAAKTMLQLCLTVDPTLKEIQSELEETI